MSLDVCLWEQGEATGYVSDPPWVREHGSGKVRQLTNEEWKSAFPGMDPCECTDNGRIVWFDNNITHNLNEMADEAGIYKHLWRPDEIGVTKARELIKPLRAGLALLRSDPKRFEAFNPPNGWGDYDGLVRFVSKYLYACEQHPDANVMASR